MYKKIYDITSYNEIKNNFDTLKFCEKYHLVNYLLIVGKKDIAFEFLKKMYSVKEESRRKQKKLDYLQLIYHINNNDKYNIDAIKYKLSRKNKKDILYYDLICEKDLKEQVKIFNKIVKSKRIIRYFINKRYRYNLIYVYLINYSLNKNPIKIGYIDRYINRIINIINKKKVINVFEISFIEAISNYIFSNLCFNYIKNNGFFIDFIKYKNALIKCVNDRKIYIDFEKEKNIQFNTIVFYALKALVNLEEFNEEENNKIIEYINEFIDNNSDEIDGRIKIYKNSCNGNFWKELEEILKNNNEKINLIELMMNMVCNNYENLNNIYTKFNKEIQKYMSNLTEFLKEEVLLGREILNLWVNGKFNKDVIKESYKMNDFNNFIIDFFNGNISKDKVEFELNNIQKIDGFEILNWNILEQKFMALGNWNWLTMILDKIDGPLDIKAIKYFQELYNAIINKNKVIFLNDFLNISDKLIKKFDNNYFFLFYSANILIQKYEDYRDAERLIVSIIHNWEKINIKNKNDYFIYLIVVIVEQNMNAINLKELNKIIENTELEINKNFIYMYLSIIYKNINIYQKEYKDILKYIIEVYKKQDEISDDLYRMIGSMAMKYEENRKILKIPDYDKIYYDNKEKYYRKTNDKILLESYKLLNLKEINSKENLKEDHSLMFLICRIFFNQIEKKGAGKRIIINSNVSGKELIEQLNEALGVDKINNEISKIRIGKMIDTLWMNVYQYSSILEDIVSSKWKIFYNSKNNRFLGRKKIIHISSAILLAKIGRLDILEKNDCYVSNVIYEETEKMSNKIIVELGRGISEEAIFYDDILDKLAKTLKILKKNQKIYSVSQAKLIPNFNVNKYDCEIIKYIMNTINIDNDFCLITEDPYLLKKEPFRDMSEGVISLLIDSFKNNMINSKELLDSIEKLKSENYNMNIGVILYKYLITKSDDENIKNIIDIINNYKINSSN